MIQICLLNKTNRSNSHMVSQELQLFYIIYWCITSNVLWIFCRKISDECFELAELCKTFNAVELKKFKGIERYREMRKIAERIETIDECIRNQYEQLPPESKSKKEKLVLHARDEARQIKLRMESEEDPRKKYVSLHGSQEFNVSLPAESSTRKMIRKSKSISTTNLNRVGCKHSCHRFERSDQFFFLVLSQWCRRIYFE